MTEPCADVNEKQCARGACSGLYPGFTQHVSLLILLPLGRQQRRGLWILSALGQPGLTDVEEGTGEGGDDAGSLLSEFMKVKGATLVLALV